MILSASRRTDLPAFYSDWFLRRLREGDVLIRNPRNPSQVSRVTLSPETVDCIVFWTKNAAPIMDQLDEIRDMGYEFYFQFTLNPYDPSIERYLPPQKARVETFRRLSRKIGRERVVWRYDPVILTDQMAPDWHFRAFQNLCDEIGEDTEECIFSFVDRYRKNGRRVSGLHELTSEEMKTIAAGFAEIAHRRGLVLATCSEPIDLSGDGIAHARCIDPDRIQRLTGCRIHAAKDQNQRAAMAVFIAMPVLETRLCGIMRQSTIRFLRC